MARGLRRGPVLLRFRSLVDSVAHYVAGIVDARQLSKVRYTLRDCYLSALALFFVHGMWLPFAITLWCQGTVGTFMRGPGPHELGHGTVFKTKWLNRFFLVPMSLLTWWSHHEYAMSHTYHHRYTLYPEGDREVVLPIDLPLKPRWTFCSGSPSTCRGCFRSSGLPCAWPFPTTAGI